MALLKVDRLRVEFPTRQRTLVAVDDVSLSLDAGEVLGVVGESGAGKSVTGAAIIGLIEPPGRIAGGEIRFAGQRIDCLPDDAKRRIRGREIGSVFQDPLTSLNPLFTVGQQLVETILAHTPTDPPQTPAGMRFASLATLAFRRLHSGSTPIRTNSRAGCASAW